MCKLYSHLYCSYTVLYCTLEETIDSNEEEDSIAWFNKGLYFVCKSHVFSKGEECGIRFNGRATFKKHLSESHGVKIIGPSIKLLKNYASNFDDSAKYECKVCSQNVLHDESVISSHLKKHSLTLESYGEQYEKNRKRKSSSDSLFVDRTVEANISARAGIVAKATKLISVPRLTSSNVLSASSRLTVR